MKQVTGNNSATSPFRVSIQQSLDGHSFSRPEPAEWPEAEKTAAGQTVRESQNTAEELKNTTETEYTENRACVEVELCLPKVVLVPESLFEPHAARELLAANGTPADNDERVVCCGPRNGVVAVVAVNTPILEQLESRYSDRLKFSTPLLYEPEKREKTVWIDRRNTVLYTKVYLKGVLQFAEAIPVTTMEETAYFLEQLGKLFKLDEYGLVLSGNDGKNLRKWFGKKFKSVICE